MLHDDKLLTVELASIIASRGIDNNSYSILRVIG